MVGGARENALVEQVVFVAVRTAGNNSARCGAVDARKFEDLILGSGVEIEKRVLAVGPTIADALGGGAGFVGGLVRSFTDFSTGVLDGGFGAFGSFGDFVARFFVPRALVRVIGIATGRSQERNASEARGQQCLMTKRQHDGS